MLEAPYPRVLALVAAAQVAGDAAEAVQLLETIRYVPVSESSASTAVTPLSVPGAPTGGFFTGGDGQASISFTPPTDTGGTPITGYTVTSSPGGLTAACTANGTTTTTTGTLSYTGTPTTQLLLWAFLLTATGLLLLKRGRRQHPHHR